MNGNWSAPSFLFSRTISEWFYLSHMNSVDSKHPYGASCRQTRPTDWSRFQGRRFLCETNKHMLYLVTLISSSARVNICVSISTFIVYMRGSDLLMPGSFSGALVWSCFIPARTLFWLFCIAMATARESLLRLHSAGNPVRVARTWQLFAFDLPSDQSR